MKMTKNSNNVAINVRNAATCIAVKFSEIAFFPSTGAKPRKTADDVAAQIADLFLFIKLPKTLIENHL